MLVVALAGVLLGVLGPVASAAGAGPADLPGPYTGVTMRTWAAPQTNLIPHPGTRAADDRDGPVTVTGSRTDTAESWTVTFTPRVGSPIAVRLFGPRIGMDQPGIRAVLLTGGVSCLARTGVTLTQYQADPVSGRPEVLSLDLGDLCYQGDSGDVMGMELHLRLAASTPYGGLDIQTDQVDMGPLTIGVATAPVSVPVRYVGAGSASVGSRTVTHPADRDFPLLVRYPVDTCSGQTLVDGSSCRVAVELRSLGGLMSLSTFDLQRPDGTLLGSVAITWDLVTQTDPIGSIEFATGRVLDTRSPVGSSPARQVPPGGVVAVPIEPVGSISSVQAGGFAVLNLTAVAPTAAGYLSVLPSSTAPTATSAVNFAAGRTTSNFVLAPMDASGRAYVRNSSSRPIDVVADCEGVSRSSVKPLYESRGLSARLHPVPPSRVLDTRTATGGARPLPTGDTYLGLKLPTFVYPSTGVLATVTVVSPSTPGWVSVGGTDLTSTLNFAAGETTSNTVLAWLSPPGLQVTVSGAPVHVVIDIVAVLDDGYSPSGIVLAPVPGGPTRIADSRHGVGLHTLVAGRAQPLVVPPSLRDQDTWGIVQNLTAIPANPTWLVAYPSGTPRPATSSLLATRPGPRAGGVLTQLAATGSQDVYSNGGPTDVVSDVTARVQLFPSTAQLGGFARIPETLAAIPPATRSR